MLFFLSEADSISTNPALHKVSLPFTGFLLGFESGSPFIQVTIGVNYINISGFNSSLSINGLIFTKKDVQSTFIEALIGWKFNL